MNIVKKLLYGVSITILIVFFNACTITEVDPNAIKSYSEWSDINAKFSEIELYWEDSYFTHNSVRVDIPDDWFGWGHKSDFDDLDKHDLNYQYKVRTITYNNGSTTKETELRDLDHEKPVESTMNFRINVLNVDIDSKILIQDELLNDYYFKYDFNEEFYNFCYFKIAKNDVNQLKDGAFNEIRLDLVIYTHFDGSKSYKIENEDGITEVGYYDNVGIYYNPDFQS